MAAKPPAGFLSNLRLAFRERFVIGDQYQPYLPPVPKSTAEGHKEEGLVYRYPAPASDERTHTSNSTLTQHNILSHTINASCYHLPPLQSLTAAIAFLCYPFPLRISSQEGADVPIRYPETVYDTQFHKRSSIKLTPPDGASEQEFRELAQPGQYPGDYPRHAPHPWWHYDVGVMEGKRRMWKESGGLVEAGAWREQKAFKRVGPDPY